MLYDLLLLSEFTWNIPLLVTLICVSFFYAYLINQFTTIKIYHKQPILFLIGLCILFLILGSPLSIISHFSFSTHMVQMSILYFIVPPFLLLGTPHLLFRQIWKMPWMKGIRKLFLTPMVALIVFALLFLMYHLPFIITAVTQYPFIHNGYMFLLFLLSFHMWWPIAAPDPSQRYDTKNKKHFSFLSGLILLPACSVLILNGLLDITNNSLLSQFTTHLCFPPDSSFSELFPISFNTRLDQIMSGVLMLGIHKLALMLTFRLGN